MSVAVAYVRRGNARREAEGKPTNKWKGLPAREPLIFLVDPRGIEPLTS